MPDMMEYEPDFVECPECNVAVLVVGGRIAVHTSQHFSMGTCNGSNTITEPSLFHCICGGHLRNSPNYLDHMEGCGWRVRRESDPPSSLHYTRCNCGDDGSADSPGHLSTCPCSTLSLSTCGRGAICSQGEALCPQCRQSEFPTCARCDTELACPSCRTLRQRIAELEGVIIAHRDLGNGVTGARDAVSLHEADKTLYAAVTHIPKGTEHG